MNIAVVGSTGVLGRAVIPLLVKQGYGVRALARSTEKAKSLFQNNVDITACDLLSPDFDRTVNTLLRDCDTVLHIATAIPRDFSAPNAWAANTRIRTEVVRMLLQAALEVGVKRYVQQSITLAYPDRSDDWSSEDTPLDRSPDRAWLCSPVITMEEMIQNVPSDDLHWCILRGGTFVGRGTSQDLIIENLRAGREVVPCNGMNFLSLIHVKDMATAVVAALRRAPAGSVFNIVDEPIQQQTYSDRLADSTGAVHPLRIEELACPPSWRCSNQQARSVLHWTPTQEIIPG